MIKKTIPILFIFSFLFVGYFIFLSKINLFNDEKTKITPQIKQQQDYIKKHEKKLNQVFEVDSIEYSVKSFEYFRLKNSKKFKLKVIIEINNSSEKQKNINPEVFYLNTYTNYLNQKFYPTYNLPKVFPNQKKQEIIYFNVIKTNSRSIGYSLNIISKQNPKQNAVVFFNTDLVR